MSMITVKHLGKAYKKYQSRWGRLAEWMLPYLKPQHTLLWVLKDVNFTVSPGEAVGIIGLNGAGKSTLLKIITGTTKQTTGEVSVTGRVAALLELGIGFHPDFTGRQNVYMSGQLLGYRLADIDSLMSQIVDFAEIGHFIDQPVRTYSSGMHVRLAFSIATAIRPDILIIDEALSVGDVQFQQKCVDRIRGFKEQGTSILFVTHDMNALYHICDKGIVLDKSGCVFQGPTAEAVEAYFSCLANRKDSGEVIDGKKAPNLIGTPKAIESYIAGFTLLNHSGDVVNTIVEGENFTIRVELKNLSEIKDPHLGIRVQDRLGVVAYESNTYCHGVFLESAIDATGRLIVDIGLKNNLSRGEYTIAFGLDRGGYGLGLFEEVVCVTRVMGDFVVTRSKQSAHWAGATNIEPHFSITTKHFNGVKTL